MGDAVKRLTSKKIDTGINTPDIGDPARRMADESKKKKRIRKKESLAGQVKRAYRDERY